MLLAGKYKSGQHLKPRWWCFLFGGNYRQHNGGVGWRPNLYRMIKRYYLEGWYRRKDQSLTSWVRFYA